MFVILNVTFTACRTFAFFCGIDTTTGEFRKECRCLEATLAQTMQKYNFVFSCPPAFISVCVRRMFFCHDQQNQTFVVLDHKRFPIARYDLQPLSRALAMDLSSNFNIIASILLATYLLQIDLTMNGGNASIIALLNRSLAPDRNTLQHINEYDATQSTGGMVLDCLPGMYTDIDVIDVDSMYPSIMLVHNTVATLPDKYASRVRDFLQQGLALKRKVDGIPILRKIVKRLINALYGAFRCPGFRLFEPKVAADTCRLGQVMVQDMKRVAERSGARVIYGVTDSIFVTGGAQDLLAAIQTHFLPFQFSRDTYRKMVIVAKNHYVALTADNNLLHRGTVYRRKTSNDAEKFWFQQVVQVAFQIQEDDQKKNVTDLVHTVEQATANLSQESRDKIRCNLQDILQHMDLEAIVSFI